MSKNGKIVAGECEPLPVPGLSATQIKALAALAAGKTVTEAARTAGVDRVTLWRWQTSDAAFIAEANRQLAELRLEIRAGLRGLAREALDAVRSVMADRYASASARLAAARLIFEAAGALESFAIGPSDAADVRRELEEVAVARATLHIQTRHQLSELKLDALLAGEDLPDGIGEG